MVKAAGVELEALSAASEPRAEILSEAKDLKRSWWRRWESNPRPKMLLAKSLHA